MVRGSSKGALLALAIGFSGVLLVSPVQANTFTPGTSGTPDTFGSITGTEVGSISGSFSGSSISGSYTEEVIRTVAGTLDFVFQVTNGAVGDVLENLSLGRFGVFTTDVGYLLSGDTAGTLTSTSNGVPTLVGNDANTVVNFQNIDLADGATSAVYAVITNATSFGGGTITFQDGSVADASALVPAPLPAALPLFGSILGAGFLIRRRRRRAGVSMLGATA